MLKHLCSIISPSIICLQETNFKGYHSYDMKNYSCFHKNRDNANIASGGVVTYVNKKYESEALVINSNLEVVGVSVSFPQKMNICNIYIPPDLPITEADISDVLDQIVTPRIIVGDFNSHNPIWGSLGINSKVTEQQMMAQKGGQEMRVQITKKKGQRRVEISKTSPKTTDNHDETKLDKLIDITRRIWQVTLKK
uniref:Uncharacterized protein LOC114342382 n=1 Tax=Diabrotica virgifera virgifera TaxID=50390 RepID=A0A6P7GUC0_DIAVI